AQLRERGTVCELDHGMNNALRMDDDLDALHLDVEKPMGFDHFQALVEERRGIDCDLRSHVPGWMFQRLLWCDRIEIFSRRFPKRSARCREHDSADVRGLKCGSGLSAAIFRGNKAPPTFQNLKNR